MNNSVFRTRTRGAAVSGVVDQYSDGKAASVWNSYIGGNQGRTLVYQPFIEKILKKHSVQTVVDVACGTGVDSIMLLNMGLKVTSIDASDKMLKEALRVRWENRRDPSYDDWIIEEGNWLTRGITDSITPPNGGYDCVVCMGNSFSHLPNFGDNCHERAIENFMDMLRPGGVLIIDHRNWDKVISSGKTPTTNIYYKGDRIKSIKTSVLTIDGVPRQVTLDYEIEVSTPESTMGQDQILDSNNSNENGNTVTVNGEELEKFRLSYYPHILKDFSLLLKGVFGTGTNHHVYADFNDEVPETCFNEAAQLDVGYFIHIITKAK